MSNSSSVAHTVLNDYIAGTLNTSSVNTYTYENLTTRPSPQLPASISISAIRAQHPLSPPGDNSMSHLNQIFEAVRQQIINWGEHAKWKIDLILLESDDTALSKSAYSGVGSSSSFRPQADTAVLVPSQPQIDSSLQAPPHTTSEITTTSTIPTSTNLTTALASNVPSAPLLQFGFILDENIIANMTGIELAKVKLRECLTRIRAFESLVKSQSDQLKNTQQKVVNANASIDTIRKIYVMRENEATLRFTVEQRLLRQDAKILSRKLRELEARLADTQQSRWNPYSHRHAGMHQYMGSGASMRTNDLHWQHEKAHKERKKKLKIHREEDLQHGEPHSEYHYHQMGPPATMSKPAQYSHQHTQQHLFDPPLRHQPRSGLDNLVIVAEVLSNPNSTFLIPPAEIPDSESSVTPPPLPAVSQMGLDRFSPSPSIVDERSTGTRSPLGDSVKMANTEFGTDNDIRMKSPATITFPPSQFSNSGAAPASLVTSPPYMDESMSSGGATYDREAEMARQLGRSRRSIESGEAMLGLLAAASMIESNKTEKAGGNTGDESAALTDEKYMDLDPTESIFDSNATAVNMVLSSSNVNSASPTSLIGDNQRATTTPPPTPPCSDTGSTQIQQHSVFSNATSNNFINGTFSNNILSNPIKKSRSPYIRWTTAQDILLRAAVEKHGSKGWDAVAKGVPGRTYHQCRQRWIKVLKGLTIDSPGLDGGEGSQGEEGIEGDGVVIDSNRRKSSNSNSDQAPEMVQPKIETSSENFEPLNNTSNRLPSFMPATPPTVVQIPSQPSLVMVKTPSTPTNILSTNTFDHDYNVQTPAQPLPKGNLPTGQGMLSSPADTPNTPLAKKHGRLWPESLNGEEGDRMLGKIRRVDEEEEDG